MPDILLLERKGVVDLESRCILETSRDSIVTKVAAKGAPNVGEHEGNVLGEVFGEDGGQGGHCIVYSVGASRDSTIGEDENSSDGVDIVLDLSVKTVLVELVLLSSAGVDQAWGVEDANLGRKMVNAHSPCS